MKNSIWTGTCAAVFALATATVLPAQQTTTAATPQPPAAAPAQADANKVKVTGCLRADPASVPPPAPTTAGTVGTSGTTAPGTPGTVGTSGTAPDQKFVLADATGDPADAASASAPKQTYRLIANATALSPHVGKRLELIGTIEDPNSAGRAADNTSGLDAARPALRVESGKIVAASCDQK